MWGASNPGRRPDTRRHRKIQALCIVLLMSWHTTLFAAQWRVQPTLQLAETYTDNVALAPPGGEESEFVTQVNPGISLHGQGGRLKLDLNYVLQNAIYASDGNRNSSNHQLAAKGNAELVKNIFFVDARSSISQQIVDATGRVGLDNLNLGNRADVFTYGLSPYLKLRLASYADAELRFSDDRVENQSSRVSDAESLQYTAHINSGPRFARLQWDADYLQQDLNRKEKDNSHYQRANANVQYHFLSSWSLLARGGYEDNRLPRITDLHNGSYWSAGLEWAPSRRFRASATKGENNWDADLFLQPIERTSLHVGYRERDVGLIRGPSWNVSLSHRTRRTTWLASYTESSTTVQTLQLTGQQFFTLLDSQGNLVVDPNTGLPIVLVQNIFSLTDQDFIRKRGQLAVTLHSGKSDIVFSVFNENRTYSLTDATEEVAGTTASWTWRFAPRTSAMIGGGWQRRNPVNTDLHEDIWNGSVALMRTVSRNVNASLEYSHLQHNTFVAFGDYGENRVTAQLNMRF